MAERVNTYDCGTIRVHAIRDAVLPVPSENFLLTGTERTERIAPGASEAVTLNCFLIEGEDGMFCLVDTGVGRSIPGITGALPDGLAALGVNPKRIGRIFLSHFHIDHIGGLVTGLDLFAPSAEILVPELELAYWTQPGFPIGAPEGQGRSRQVIKRLLDELGRRIRPVSPEIEPVFGVAQVPLPGHTPGHTGLRVRGTRELLIWGDILHSAPLQCSEPDWGYIADVDAVAAARLRHRMLSEVARSGTVVAGMHLPAPGFGRIAEEDGGYRFLPLGGR